MIKPYLRDMINKYETKGGGKDKNLSPKEYLDMIRPYLRDMLNNHKTIKE